MKPCLIPDCSGEAGRPGTARGWCSKHYSRWQSTGDPLVKLSDLKPREPAICQVEGCERPRWARQMCSMHLFRWRTTGDAGSAEPQWMPRTGNCRIKGCERPVRVGVKRLCNRHYIRSYRHGDPLGGGAYYHALVACAAEGCREDYYAKGWCGRHYRMFVDRKAHRRRSKAAPGVATPEAIASRMAIFGWRCWMCGGSFTTVDHAIPLRRGGTNWPANLRPACLSCNSRKSDRDLWLVMQAVRSGEWIHAQAKEIA